MKPETAPKEIVGGFLVTKLLAEGSYALVYEAQPCGVEKKVAVKIPKSSDAAARERLKSEASFLCSANTKNSTLSAHFPEVVMHDSECETPYTVMELLECTLEQRLKDPNLHWRTAADLAIGILDGLSYIHSHYPDGVQMIHGDLKPKNVMLTRKGFVKLIDVYAKGAKKKLEEVVSSVSVERSTNRSVITPLYAAPEQLGVVKADITCRADIYAVGTILYEMLTKKVPFGQARKLTRQESPEWLESIIEKARAQDPHDRYATANDMCEELAKGLNGIFDKKTKNLSDVVRELATNAKETVVGVGKGVLYILSLPFRGVGFAARKVYDTGHEIDRGSGCVGLGLFIGTVFGTLVGTACLSAHLDRKRTKEEILGEIYDHGRIAYCADSSHVKILSKANNFDPERARTLTLSGANVKQILWSSDSRSLYFIDETVHPATYRADVGTPEWVSHKLMKYDFESDETSLVFDPMAHGLPPNIDSVASQKGSRLCLHGGKDKDRSVYTISERGGDLRHGELKDADNFQSACANGVHKLTGKEDGVYLSNPHHSYNLGNGRSFVWEPVIGDAPVSSVVERSDACFGDVRRAEAREGK